MRTILVVGPRGFIAVRSGTHKSSEPVPEHANNWLREGSSLTVGDRVDVRVKSVDGPNKRVIVGLLDNGAQFEKEDGPVRISEVEMLPSISELIGM